MRLPVEIITSNVLRIVIASRCLLSYPIEFLNQVENPAWRKVYLAHLSRDCNAVSVVRERFSEPLAGLGNRKCNISVVDPDNGTLPPYEF